MLSEVNFLAVAVAALAPMAIGGIWYGPLFGKLWMSGAANIWTGVYMLAMGAILGAWR